MRRKVEKKGSRYPFSHRYLLICWCGKNTHLVAYFLIISSYVGKKYFEMGRYFSGYMTSLFRFPRIVSLWKMMSNLPAVNSYLEFIIPSSFILTHLLIFTFLPSIFYFIYSHPIFNLDSTFKIHLLFHFPNSNYFFDFNVWIY